MENSPSITLIELVDRISVRTYHELEERYSKRIAEDKRLYGKDFELIREEWVEKNKKLHANEDAVWKLKSEFNNKIKKLRELEKEKSPNNMAEIVALLDDIITFIDMNKDVRIDDRTSWYSNQSQPEFTFAEYIEKYGYKNYFQNLRQQYAKELGLEEEIIDEKEPEEILVEPKVEEKSDDKEPEEVLVEPKVEEKSDDTPQKEEEVKSADTVQNETPSITLIELVDRISVRTYHELEERYSKRIAEDKRLYGKDFELIREEWVEKNKKLHANEDAVWKLKSEFNNKIKKLRELEKEKSPNNMAEIVALLDDIITFIDMNKDVRIDDRTSWYSNQSQPEFTFAEYIEKYGYKNYFQNLKQQYAKELGLEEEIIDEKEPEEVLVEASPDTKTSSINSSEEIRRLQREKYRVLFIELMRVNERLNNEMNAVDLSEEEKAALREEIMKQVEQKQAEPEELSEGKTM